MRRTYSAVLLVMIMALVLAACGGSSEPNQQDSAENKNAPTSALVVEPTTEKEAEHASSTESVEDTTTSQGVKSAREITLNVDDLGDGWMLRNDENGVETLGFDPQKIIDVNKRSFSHRSGEAAVNVQILIGQSVEALEFDPAKGIDGLKKDFGESNVKIIDVPAIADEQAMASVLMKQDGVTIETIVLMLRKKNVGVILGYSAREGNVPKDKVAKLASTIVARIP